VVLGLGAGGVVVWHTQRRLGGVTGDVLGAVCELTTTVIYLAASI
jgi:adenosylcobinamide-GDP ribazoletransferase